MSDDLAKITKFIDKHHVLTLATSDGEELSACSAFYAYSQEKISFIIASSDDTTHIQNIKKNKNIAGNILLETKIIGKIQGVQFRGDIIQLKDKELVKVYYQAFPYAKLMRPKLWIIQVNWFKMTHNKLGFGKKIIWDKE